MRAISLALGLALSAPVAADDGGPRHVRRAGDSGPGAPGDAGPATVPRSGDAPQHGDPQPLTRSEDEEILRDLEMLMLFDMLRDYDLFAEDEK